MWSISGEPAVFSTAVPSQQMKRQGQRGTQADSGRQVLDFDHHLPSWASPCLGPN